MGRPRLYTTHAEQQAAYRARKQAEQLQQPARAPTYQKWRKAIQEASNTLEATYEEIHYWMQERSERWQESDRAADMEADRDQLQEIIETIANLNIWRKGHD